MYYGGYGLYFDWTYILVILAFVLSMIVQTAMQSTFRKYSRVRSSYGMTGAQVAQRILESEGIYGVQVRPVRGNLTDHYDPRSKTVNLSESIYGSTSVAALGVAAHECGHAIQDARDYAPLRIRSALVPAANFGSQFSWILFFIGLVLQSGILTEIGILLFCFALLFQLVTLPVEFNASRRAVNFLESTQVLDQNELVYTKKVLGAAAMTYVAGAAASILQLLRILLIAGGGRRN